MGKIFIILFVFLFPLTCFAQNPTNQPSKKEVNQEQVYIPSNLDECFGELKKILKKEDLEQFKNKKEEDAVSGSHFGLGMWIRNNWGLWKSSRLTKYFKDLGISHPDDMSGIILTSFYRYLNNKNIELEKQIKHYKEYWEDQKRMDVILRQLKSGSFDLDVSGFNISKEKSPLGKDNIDKYLRYGISNAVCNDCFEYTVILERGSGKFWIHKTGGFAGVDILYGPGTIDKSGEIKRK